MRVYRKYPEKERLKVLYRQLEGAIFTASDHEKKRRYFDTLHTLDYVPHPYLQEVTLHNTRKYRYYHFSNLKRQSLYRPHGVFRSPFFGTCLYATYSFADILGYRWGISAR